MTWTTTHLTHANKRRIVQTMPSEIFEGLLDMVRKALDEFSLVIILSLILITNIPHCEGVV